MGFYRVFPSKDNWITDAHPDGDVTTRATGSNHGRSPALNVFARKADINSASIELARSLVQFDLAPLSGLIFDEQRIPSSSVDYILKMYDMKHDDMVPTSYDLFVYPLSRSWDEGTGIDDDKHRDLGFSNWLSASSTQGWTISGSDFLTTGYGSGSQHFDLGPEDLEMNITSMVNAWLTGGLTNNGLVVKFGNPEETNTNNYFKKIFHGRESKFVDRIPVVEARWAKVLKDNRDNFAYNNDNTLAMYHFVRGELTNPGTVFLRVVDHLDALSQSFSQSFNTGQYETGILTASINISNTASFSGTVLYDIWETSTGVTLLTGTLMPLVLTGSTVDPYDEFVVNVNNLKRVYHENEEARVVVNVRKRNFITHKGSVTSASLDLEKEFIEKMYYSITNNESGETVVPFGTGSSNAFTQLSYNSDGNYFDLYFNTFVPGITYRIKFLIDINTQDRKIIDDDFIFRVE